MRFALFQLFEKIRIEVLNEEDRRLNSHSSKGLIGGNLCLTALYALPNDLIAQQNRLNGLVKFYGCP
ncbi:hypothetical protein DBR17_04460 [Sphingomonas sp. HMWF008]|nr:hypothetical protein DBR17_04460 [Sphingomonas sp. HMWF008]